MSTTIESAAERLDPGLSGVAGEYFVAAELSRRGYIACITLKNTRGVDLLVSNRLGQKAVGVQVKTNQGGGKEWLLTQRDETIANPNLFYAFVNLNRQGKPEYHVVPSPVVAQFISRDHLEWLAGVKKNGGARKDTPMRTFRDREGKYKDAWHLLGLQADTDCSPAP